MAEYWEGCVGCIDFAPQSHNCEYLRNNGHVRPCKAGPKGCDMYSRTPREEQDMSKARQWDTVRARALLDEGYTPLEVADRVGASVNAVKAWIKRERNGTVTTVRAEPHEETALSRAEDGKPQDGMLAHSLGELLMTAAKEYKTPLVLLPDGEPVRSCRVELTYGVSGAPERVEIRLI